MRDITLRKRAADVEARLAALVRSTRAAVIGWRSDGTVTDWNEGAVRMFGDTAAEICGRALATLSVAGERRGLERLVAGPVTPANDREVVMRHKDGHIVHVAWTAAAVRDARGRVIGASGVGADISARARLERQVAMLADEQRQQLGRDLHDSLGQQLTAVGLLVSSLRDRAPSTELLAKLDAGIDAAKSHLRAILKGLAPVEIDASGLVVALDELAEYTRATHAIECRLDCPDAVEADDNFTANQLYLIAREAVHNAVKHAAPRRIVIRLRRRGALSLAVEDDGSGLLERASGDGMGLRIMSYRCHLLGGELSIGRGEAGGTLLSCTVPAGPDAPTGAGADARNGAARGA